MPKGKTTAIKTYEERIEREKQVKKMIDEGKSQNEIAREFDVTPQSIHKFLKVRGWKTKGAKAIAQRKAATG